ncbi:MAG: efflux RND transporter periplasmic adaptor subunit [bacterium]
MTKSRKRLVWIVALVVVVGGSFAAYNAMQGNNKTDGPKTVTVARMDVIDKALAVGTIDPEIEISVKSKVSGVVSKLFVDAGDYVNAGASLLEVKPNPTPLELAEATRDVEMKQIALAQAEKERNRLQELRNRNLISQKEYDEATQTLDEAKIRHSMAIEKLALIEKGKIRIANTNIESVVKAPVSGYVLEKMIEVGDPVVPLTTFQEGTVLMTIADMRKLVFKGTVDEIDVGKLREGMQANIDIGAIPGDDKIKGVLNKISLKAKKENNTTVFPVEIELTYTNGSVLRAGYSANANIIIEKRENVLAIPERVVTLRNDSALVKILDENGLEKEIAIVTGLSDAINIEVVSGLDEKQKVLEKPVKVIE